MAHATFVKKARKAYKEDGIKKGESYYWWSFRDPRGKGGSGKYRSKTQPTRSQLTRSEFYSTLFEIEDRMNRMTATGYDSVGSFEGDVEGMKSDLDQLATDTEEKLNNMPEGLQQGDTGQLLQDRIDAVQDLVSEFDGLDFAEPSGVRGKKKIAAAVEERVGELIEELQGFNWSL